MVVEQEVDRWERLFAKRTSAGAGDEIAWIMALASRTDIISFCGGIPDPATFPGPELAEILAELSSTDPGAFQYAPTPGLESTCDFVAERLLSLSGSRPADQELLLTSGGIDALGLIGKALIDPGDVVFVENPSYLGSIMSFLGFEAEVVGIPMDDAGLDVDALEARLKAKPSPKLLYTIPDFQNPTGLTLSAERRAPLVELARLYGFLIVEDVCYRELAFRAEQPPTLWGQAPDVVVQIGTFSKTFFPGVRLGWAVGPRAIVSKLVWAKQTADQCASALGQRLLEEYGRRGYLDAKLLQARKLYAQRGEQMLAALGESMPSHVQWTTPSGGFYTWLTLQSGADTRTLAERAMQEGVAFVPGAPFSPDGSARESLRISFSRARESEIVEGIERLGRLFAGTVRAGATG
jgi:2-aminoadipate transaminase